MKKSIWKSIIACITTGALLLSPMSILANEEDMESVSEREIYFETEPYEDDNFDVELDEISAQDAEYMTEGEFEITEDVIDDFTDETINEIEDGMLEEDVLEAAAGEDILVDNIHFPDDNFRSYVKGSFDTDNNGYLSSEERNAVDEIDVDEQQIKDLSGIAYFQNLKYLYCGTNQLTSLDASDNKALRELRCDENQLAYIDVSGCTIMYRLVCDDNQLTSLDVSNNTLLTELNCRENQLTSLDVTNNTALEDLDCVTNQLTSLNVANNTALKYLYVADNQLTSLDVTNNTALKSLWCDENQLTSLDVTKNTALHELWCHENQLASLNVSNNISLDELRCHKNQLTSLNVSNNTLLTELKCGYNQLTSLDVSNNTLLTELRCEHNQLTSLDASNQTALKILYCENNQLTSLNVNNSTMLKELTCEVNQLTSLDVSNCANLYILTCDFNQLTTLDISNCPNLELVYSTGERTDEHLSYSYSTRKAHFVVSYYLGSGPSNRYRLQCDRAIDLVTSTGAIKLNIYNSGEETYSFENYSDLDSPTGHCFGMSMTSAGYYNNLLNIGVIGGSSDTSLYSFRLTQTVKKPICKYQGIQGSYSNSAIVAGGSDYLGYSNGITSDWQAVVNYVKNHSYDGKGLLQIGFRKKDEGGHAINFLRYENVDGQDRIYAYDNNFPNIETYFYKDSSGRVFQAPRQTFSGAIDAIALRDVRLYFNNADSFDATHVLYMEENAASVEGYPYTYMDTDLPRVEYVMYEIPADQDQVRIVPKVDNASFVYMDTKYNFGNVDDDTYGVFKLSSTGEGGAGSNEGFKIYNAPAKQTSKKAVITEKITITKKPSIKKPAAAKGKVTVKWKHFKHTSKKTKKIWKKIKKVQIQCATDKAFKNIVKTATVKKSKTSAKIKGLKKKTTYYVRVRYYDGTGYSAWSKVKKVKTK